MRTLALAALLSAGATAASAQADADAGQVPLARIEKIVVDDQDRPEATDTEVRVIRSRSGRLVPARRALALFQDDQVITGANVSLVLLFQGEAAEEEKKAVVGVATQVRLRSRASLFLILGRILSNVRGFFEVERPEGVLGARGTEFEVQGEDDGSTRLLVFEGAVEVGGKAGAKPGEPAPPAVRATVSAGRSASSSLSLALRNRCAQEHIYEIRAPESLAWVSLVGERLAVAPGSKRTVELSLRLDATRIDPGPYRGEVIVKCLDCDQEPGCSITSEPIPLEVTVGGDGASFGPPAEPFANPSGSRVGRLEEITLPRGRPPDAPRKATEGGVRSALDWSSNVLLAGRPAYSRRGSALYFESVRERDRAFREARFRAVWAQSAEGYETVGNIYCDWGEGAKGLEAYLRAGKASPSRQASPAFVAGMAVAYRLKGRLKEADEKVRQALGLDPRQPLALVTLGNLRLDQASIARDAADNARARDLLGGALQAFDDATRANAGRNLVAIAHANRGEAYLALGDLLRQEGKADEARERFEDGEKAFQAAQGIHPPYPYSDTGLADVYRGYFNVAAARGDKARALSYLRQSEERYGRALKENRAPFAAWTGAGTLYRDVGRDDRAIEAYTRAVELRPGEPLAYWRLGTALAKADPRRAALYLRTYLDLEAPAFKQGQRAKQAEAIVKGGGPGDSLPPPPPRVPDVQGLSLEEAERTLRAAGFQRGGIERRPRDQRAGMVIEQQPGAGEPATAGTRVDLVVSGPGPVVGEVKVPKVEGDREEDAVEELRKRRLVPRVVRQASCEKVGRVIAQAPRKDARVPEGSPVTITLAWLGERPVRVPPLEGMPRQRAEAFLRKNGLTVGRVRATETNTVEPGIVLDQDPEANEPLAPGCPVDLTVAEPEPLVRVPDFQGMSEKDAISRLSSPGNVATSLTRGRIYGGGSGGRIVDQDPKAGSQVPRGTPVSLWIRTEHRPEPPPDRVPVPNVRDYDLKSAADTIQRAGLVATVRGRGGCVARQYPAEKTTVARGSTVTLYAGQCPIK